MVAQPERGAPRIVAIASGKGGVGKSTIATNLAMTLARLGQRVVLVDADLGAPNLHTMLGVVHSPNDLAAYLDETLASLEPARIVVSPTLSLIAGTARPGSASPTGAQRLRLIRALRRLDADVVVVDVGAGTAVTVVDLVASADLKLFVVTPHLPSLHNAYALLKACVHRVSRKLARDDLEQGLIDAALGSDHKARTIVQLLQILRRFEGDLGDRIEDTLARFGVGLVSNQVTTTAEAEALARMSPMIFDHLNVQAPVITTIRKTAALGGGLKAGIRTVDVAPETAAAFRRLANHVSTADLAQLRDQAPVVPSMPRHATVPLWIMRFGEDSTAR